MTTIAIPSTSEAPARTPERDTFLAVVLIAAVGHSRYWSRCREFQWWLPGFIGGHAEPARSGGGNAWARLIDEHDTEHLVTLDTIEAGLTEIESACPEFMDELDRRSIRFLNRHSAIHPHRGALTSAQRPMSPALADQILQVGLLGTLVYG
ncbi:hypothetical protein SAMN05428985_11531 [Nocardioides sp. YR527]|uniref:hypothetical protein n=1 Tax=Nocardioides sp. YR527 TaxID=1881028 RepID=UPI000886E8A1|nr:hypothetical protein [Nocardioides sp. YR527]SDL34099.1 hypothetical protein SAMN05428985_11531 [Nocardioides sp. YR527]